MTIELIREPDKAALAARAGAALIETVRRRLDEQAQVQVALTGGSMGSAIIAAARDHGAESVDWTRVVIWWGDERYLPAGDADRNDTQNDAAGLAQLGLLPQHVHRVAGPDASPDAEASATAYADQLRAAGGGQFDVVLLGVGPDGHVASLFPHHPAQQVTGATSVAVHDSPKPPPDRVSLTFEALCRAREVWFLVAGADKAAAVAAAHADGVDRWEVPAAGVHGSERTVWWLDEAAAANLA